MYRAVMLAAIVAAVSYGLRQAGLNIRIWPGVVSTLVVVLVGGLLL